MYLLAPTSNNQKHTAESYATLPLQLVSRSGCGQRYAEQTLMCCGYRGHKLLGAGRLSVQNISYCALHSNPWQLYWVTPS